MRVRADGAPPLYTITDLGTFGGNSSRASAINERGQVVGSAGTASGHVHAFFWDKGRLHDLDTVGGKNSTATAINNHGEVVGILVETKDTHPQDECRHAFLWRRGRMIDLNGWIGATGELRLSRSDENCSEAVAINNNDLIAGTVNDLPILWQRGHTRTLRRIRIPFPRNYGWWDVTAPSSMNDRGDVVGNGGADGNNVCFLWRNGVGHNLGRLGASNIATDGVGHRIRYEGTVALFSINNRRQAVGQVDFRAIVWQYGSLRFLAALPGLQSEAHGINNGIEIVGRAGRSLAGKGPTRAVLWSGGRAFDLNRLIAANAGWVLQEANAVNNKGQIVGTGLYHGRQRAFLLTPITGHHRLSSGVRQSTPSKDNTNQ